MKIPRPETLLSSQLSERFSREAKAVASLVHPHLLRFFEAGFVGPVGYLVQEYCPGPNLAAWRKQQTCTIPTRWAAQLIAHLASAVDYIHSRGIVHRDIKPANVLLYPTRTDETQDGDADLPFTPKLTDFGLAKLLEQAADQTRTGDVLGTPAYMSPEQAAGHGQRIGPRSDIYSLGAILYELLTGHPPAMRTDSGPTPHRVREGQVAAPRHFCHSLPPDLAAVCAKCLDEDPQRRYASGAELAADLKRHLMGIQVRARPVGPMSRLARGIWRRPLVGSLIVVLVGSWTAATLGLSLQWRSGQESRQQAITNFRQSHEAVKRFQELVSRGGHYNQPHLLATKWQVLQSAIDEYQRLQTHSAHDPSLISDVADAYYELGFVAESTHEAARALQLYSQSLRLWRDLEDDSPEHAKTADCLAKVHRRLGHVKLIQGQPPEMVLPDFRTALDLRRRLAQSRPDDLRQQLALADALMAIGDAHRRSRRNPEAFAAVEESRTIAERLVQIDGKSIEFIRQLGHIYGVLSLLCLDATDWDQAIDWSIQAEQLVRPLADRDIDTPWSADILAGACQRQATALWGARQQELSLQTSGKAIDLHEQLCRRFPQLKGYVRKLAGEYHRLGKRYFEIGRYDEALSALNQGRDRLRQALETDPSNASLSKQLSNIEFTDARFREWLRARKIISD
jgi:serine/threonine protein kinase